MMPILKAVGAAVLSGACFYFCNGLGEIWPLAWVAALPILWLAYGEEPPWHVALAAFAAFAAGQMNVVIAYLGELPFPVLMIFLLVPSLAFAVGALFARFARRLRPLAAALAFPALWTAWEYVVASLTPDGSAGAFAYSQAAIPEMIQSASVFGLWIVTFLLMLNSSLLAMALRRPRQSRALAGIALILFGANVLFAEYRLNQEPGEKIQVALVASDALGEAAMSNDGVTALRTVSAYIAASRNAIKNGAEAVVMPEKLAVLEPAWREDALSLLRTEAARGNVTLVAGFDLRGEARRNVAFVFQPGLTPYEYDKRRLLGVLEGMFQPGLRPGVFAPTRAVVVCKDMDFPDMIRADAQDNVRIMFVPAWDFGADGWLHARMAIMRGVENGFAVARAARDGYLTATDAQGRVVAGTPTTRTGFVSISANLPLGPGSTVYKSIGDAFAWLCLGLTLALLVLCFITKPREGDTQAQAVSSRHAASPRTGSSGQAGSRASPVRFEGHRIRFPDVGGNKGAFVAKVEKALDMRAGERSQVGSATHATFTMDDQAVVLAIDEDGSATIDLERKSASVMKRVAAAIRKSKDFVETSG